ncbi:MAG: radical SAM protein [Desulfitibacter sp. BRH_c19]|nr:MAG: radical SAM protein [Desulfitibacter sp. BRH_c19]
MSKKYEPGYIKLLGTNKLEAKVLKARTHYTNCNLCPHECNVDRQEKTGFCRALDKAIISSNGPHFGEESVLVGRHGSGTIFFGYCNMKCVFCQNCELSFGGEGKIIENSKLAEIMLNIQNRHGCHNINLVTPTHFVPNILEALLLAARNGLKIPIVYNCGGYERMKTLELLDGVVDIYMPDFKYSDDSLGEKYSNIKSYSTRVKQALKEMDRQVGGLKVDKNNIAYRGLIIRHLVMPGNLNNSKEVLEFIQKELSPDCLVNLMDQYHPAHKAFQYKEISRGLTKIEFMELYSYAKNLGLRLAE